MKEPEFSVWQMLGACASLAGFGGIVNYLTTVKAKKNFRWADFFIEFVCSAFVGIIFGAFFVATDMPILLAFAGAGVAGHMGTRSLMVLREAYRLSGQNKK